MRYQTAGFFVLQALSVPGTHETSDTGIFKFHAAFRDPEIVKEERDYEYTGYHGLLIGIEPE